MSNQEDELAQAFIRHHRDSQEREKQYNPGAGGVGVYPEAPYNQPDQDRVVKPSVRCIVVSNLPRDEKRGYSGGIRSVRITVSVEFREQILRDIDVDKRLTKHHNQPKHLNRLVLFPY